MHAHCAGYRVTVTAANPGSISTKKPPKTNNDTCGCKHLFDKAISTKRLFAGYIVAKAHILHWEIKLCYS